MYTIFRTYFRVKYHSSKKVPLEGRLLIVANHQSFLDPPLVGVGLPRTCNYMARETLFNTIIGWHIRHLNAFPVSLEGKNALAGIKETLKRLKNEQAVLIFPEGTRSVDGKIGEFHRGIISVAKRSKSPILPCAIQGAFEAWPRQARLPRPHKVHVTYGDVIPAEKVQELSDDELLAYLRNSIAEMIGDPAEVLAPLPESAAETAAAPAAPAASAAPTEKAPAAPAEKAPVSETSAPVSAAEIVSEPAVQESVQLKNGEMEKQTRRYRRTVLRKNTFKAKSSRPQMLQKRSLRG